AVVVRLGAVDRAGGVRVDAEQDLARGVHVHVAVVVARVAGGRRPESDDLAALGRGGLDPRLHREGVVAPELRGAGGAAVRRAAAARRRVGVADDGAGGTPGDAASGRAVVDARGVLQHGARLLAEAPVVAGVVGEDAGGVRAQGARRRDGAADRGTPAVVARG